MPCPSATNVSTAAPSQSRRSIGPAGRLSVSSLSNNRNTTRPSTEPDGEIGEEGAAAEGGGRRREQDRGGGDESAAEADERDQRGEAAEDQEDRLGIGALARRQFAAQRHHQVADGKERKAGADDERHRLGTDAVDRRDLQIAGVPEDHAGQSPAAGRR